MHTEVFSCLVLKGFMGMTWKYEGIGPPRMRIMQIYATYLANN